MTNTKKLWILWLCISIPIGGVLIVLMIYGGNRAVLLIGRTTDAHHQIELACGACHTSPFGGREVLQKACVDCHGAELKLSNDTHPRAKFVDPRNADRVKLLDARYCMTCHREHKPAITNVMAVTLPTDFCVTCHTDIAKDRPSHEGLAFTTCASAGCHNFHDNRALYEDFLEAHMHEADLLPAAIAYLHGRLAMTPVPARTALVAADADGPAEALADPAILSDWEMTTHAEAGVNCSGCHVPRGTSQWVEKPAREVCATCHAEEARTFVEGKHGMRLRPGLFVSHDGPLGITQAQVLTPMRPDLARLPMKDDAHGRELVCTTCHSAHRFDVVKAAVEACASCHADDHTKTYFASPHFRLVEEERAGLLPPGSGITCATCHMPRVESRDADGHPIVVATHNQNDNLRPNEKMVRSVCASCHGLQFTLDALADPGLVDANFNGAPKRHVESLEWVERRMRERGELQ